MTLKLFKSALKVISKVFGLKMQNELSFASCKCPKTFIKISTFFFSSCSSVSCTSHHESKSLSSLLFYQNRQIMHYALQHSYPSQFRQLVTYSDSNQRSLYETTCHWSLLHSFLMSPKQVIMTY